MKPRQTCNSVAAIKHNGVIYNTPEELCAVWQCYYDSLLNEQPSEAERYDAIHQEDMQKEADLLNRTFNNLDDATGTLSGLFTVNEIANVCKGLPRNKAAGYDSIAYECAKFGGHKLYEMLAYLFNNIVHHMYIPTSMKHSIIIPLYKGKQKPKSSLNSYRGVSLTPL